MGPLECVDWRKVNFLFCTLMWTVALILGVYVLYQVVPQAPVTHHLVAIR